MPDSFSGDRRTEHERDWHRVLGAAGEDAIVSMDDEGRVVDWSARAEELFGYTRREAVGQMLAALIVPERYRDSHWAGLERFRQSGQARILNKRLELSAVSKDGREFPIQLTISLLRLGDAPVFVGFAREAHRKPSIGSRRARMALESRLLHQVANLSTSSESFDEALQKCLEVMCSVTGWPVGHVFIPDQADESLTSTDIWHFSEERRWLAVREASRNVVFRRGEGLPGRVWESGEAVWSANVQNDAWFCRGESEELGVRGAFAFPVTVDGHAVAILEFFTQHEIAPDPQLLMLVSSIGTQLGRIIERRKWEDDRAHLAAIVDGSYDAIISKSLDATIISWNTGAEQTYGYTAEEAIGESIALILPEGVTEEEVEIRQAVMTGQRLTQFETFRRRKDGAEIAVAVTVSPIRDSQGRIIGSSTVERDITRVKRREQEFKKARAAAEEARETAEIANRTKSDFLANISHELRTPMNAIIGMLDLARGENVDPMVDDYLETARESASTLLHLVDDLLDFSRMEAGRLELEAEPFNIRELVDGVARALSLRASEKGLELVTRVDSAVPHSLDGDDRRLRQVLMNLAGNAIKFTEQGEVLISLTVQSRSDEQVELAFSVADTGCGIAAEDQDSIFAPFTQVDSSATRKHSGTGLGLAICRELVERMGGRISVASEPEKGSVFRFTARFDVLADTPAYGLPIPRLYNEPILIVDDSQTTLAILEEFLTGWGMVPVRAGSGQEALNRLREAAGSESPVQVAIIDALMPELDGFTLIETMRDAKLLPETVVLMMSSGDRQTFRQRYDTLPVDAWLDKPVSPSDLLEVLTHVTEGPRTAHIRHGFARTNHPLRILVAEDTPANQKVVRAMLEKRGHQAVIASNGREALERLRQEQFDAVLMDIQMPTMDGLQATSAIRKMTDPQSAGLPIIAMTAHARREDRRRCRDAGMDAYISKPIEFDRLIRTVESTNRHSADALVNPWSSDPSMDTLPEISQGGFSVNSSAGSGMVNYDAALQRLSGKRELFASLAQFFLDDSPDLIEQLRRGLQAKDVELVTRSAHSLKGLAANFDAEPVRQLAQQIEDCGHTRRFPQVASLLPELTQRVEQLQRELQQYL